MVAEQDKISGKTKLNYGLGSFGINLSSGIFGAWTQNYYIKMVGIDPLLWGFAWIVYLFWNAINDPIFGYISDNTRTRFGRRIPFMMACTPLLSISFALMYFTPMDSTQIVYFIWLLFTLIAYDTCFTIIGLCYGALMSELTIEPTERASMNLFQALGGGGAFILTYVLPFLLIQNVQPYSQNIPLFQSMVIILAIIGGIFLAFTSFGIKEKPELLPEKQENLGLIAATKTTLKNKSFLTFVLFNFMMTYIGTAVLANISFYIQDVLNISGGGILSSIPLVLFAGCAVLGFPLGIKLNGKIGGKKTVFYLSLLVALGLTLVTFANDIVMANIAFAILGFGFSGQQLLCYTLLADVIDEDELETGIRREGAYFGVNALITKPSQSLSAWIAGFIFFITLYNQDLGPGETQPESAVFGIKLLVGLIPAVFLVIGLLALWFYPLDGSTEEFKEMKRKVSLLHDEKLERLRKKLAGLEENG